MISMSGLVKQAGIISAADFVRLFVKTVIGIFLARILTQADFGSYRQLFMIYTLVSAIFMVGLPQSVYYFIPKSDEETRKKIIAQTIDFISIFGLAASLLIIVSRSYIATLFNNPQLYKILVIYAFYPFFMFVSQLYYNVMIALQKPRQAAKFVLISIICDFVLILGVAIVTRNLMHIALAIVVSVLIQWIYARLSLKKHISGVGLFCYDRDLIKSQFRFSLPIGVAAVIGVISTQIDKLVISSYFTPELFAVFSIGATELPFIGIITNSVNAVILPEMSRRSDDASITDLYRGAVRKNALLLFPIFVFCFIFAPHIIQILYSVKYLDAVIFFRIYLFTMPLRIATYGILFQVFNKTRYIFIMSLLTLIANTILSLFLIRYMGIKGPALAATIVTYSIVAVYLLLIKRKLDLSLTQLFPVGALGRTLLASLLSGLIAFPVLFVVKGIFLQFFTGAFLFLVLYYAIANLTGAILPYDNNMLRSIFRNLVFRMKGLTNGSKI